MNWFTNNNIKTKIFLKNSNLWNFLKFSETLFIAIQTASKNSGGKNYEYDIDYSDYYYYYGYHRMWFYKQNDKKLKWIDLAWIDWISLKMAVIGDIQNWIW